MDRIRLCPTEVGTSPTTDATKDADTTKSVDTHDETITPGVSGTDKVVEITEGKIPDVSTETRSQPQLWSSSAGPFNSVWSGWL